MKNHYEILGVDQTADSEAIKAAFRKKAVELHPDKNQGSEEAAQQFKELSAAHDILKDPKKRELYDQELAMRSGGFRQTFHARDFNTGNGMGPGWADILNDVQRNRRGGFSYQQVKNSDVNLKAHITLEEAFTGKELDVNYFLPDDTTRRTIKVKIPAGIDSGLRIRYAGQGSDKIQGIPRGDLFISIYIIHHPKFVRFAEHLATSIIIDYIDAMLGAKIEVSTIDGPAVRLTVPAGTGPGQTLRCAGKGMPIPHTNKRGDMLVEIVVVSPKLTDEQKSLLETIRSKKE